MYSSLPVPFGSNATVAIRSALPTSVELLHRNVDICPPLPLTAPSYVVWNSSESTPATTSSWFWNSGTHPSVPYGLLRSVALSVMPVCRRLRQHDLRQHTCQHTAYQQQTTNSFFHFSSSLPYEINGFHGFPLALLRSTVRGYRYFTLLSV